MPTDRRGQLNIRVDPAKKTAWEGEAKRRGMSLTEWLTAAADSTMPGGVPPAAGFRLPKDPAPPAEEPPNALPRGMKDPSAQPQVTMYPKAPAHKPTRRHP